MKKILVIMIVTGLLFATGAYSQPAAKKSLGGAPVKSTEEVKKESGKKELPKATAAPAKADTKKAAKSAKPIKGKVVSLTNLYLGKAGAITKDEAVKMADKGDPIVFMVGDGKKGKIYFVYNTDGTFGGKNLAKYANNKNVGIVGKTKTINGVNYIIAEIIESMD
jgi:hypothetical protein